MKYENAETHECTVPHPEGVRQGRREDVSPSGTGVHIATRRPIGVVAILVTDPYADSVSTMNISLPDTLKAFVERQVSERGYGTSSEYVRELIRRDQDQQRLRALVLEGAASAPAGAADATYFAGLRSRVVPPAE